MSTLPILLTTEDLVKLFGVGRRTILNWRKSGKIPTPRQIGRHAYWSTAEVQAFLENRDAS